MDTTSLTITPEAARHVLWRYDRTGGAEPGPFTKHLMAAIAHADLRHRAVLREAFPELSEALRIAHSQEDGLAKLQAIACRGAQPLRCARCEDEDGPFTDEQLCEPCARPMPLDGVA
jgi:hypothetical protein